ncbi:MAG: ComEC/Rec2 family competence protein [Pseudomonadota bacterium]
MQSTSRRKKFTERSPWCWKISRPLVLLACALSLGAFLGSIHPIPTIHIIALAFFFIGCIFVACVLYERAPHMALALFICAFFVFGYARASSSVIRTIDFSFPLGGEKAILCEGKIADIPQEKKWGLRFVLKLSKCRAFDQDFLPAKGSVRINANYRFIRDELFAGDKVQVKLTFKTLDEIKYPSYRNYLLSRGIGAKATAKSTVERVSEGTQVLAFVNEARKRIWNSLYESIAQPEASVVAALATGRRYGMDDEIRSQFSQAGLAHLLAISGLHVGYVTLIIYFLVKLTLGRIPWVIARIPLARMAAFFTVPLMWFYVFFTGSAMSAIRAGTMLTIYLIGIILGMKHDLLTTIAASVIAIIVISPLAVLDVSFQLSASAVIGIALIAMPLVRRMGLITRDQGMVHKAIGWFFTSLIITFAATAFTAPLIAYHFKTFTAAGLLANLVAVPLVGFALQPAVLAASTLSLCMPSVAFYVWKIAGFLAGALIHIAHGASDYGSFLAGKWALSWQGMFLAYAVLVLLMLLLWRKLLVTDHW